MRGPLTVTLDPRLGSCTINDADGVTVARCLSVLDADELAGAFNALGQVTTEVLAGMTFEPDPAAEDAAGAPIDEGPDPSPSGSGRLRSVTYGSRKWGE